MTLHKTDAKGLPPIYCAYMPNVVTRRQPPPAERVSGDRHIRGTPGTSGGNAVRGGHR
ncbi:hypothetical protein SGPA1_20082 [Streptomyces misionensis JCM 4497]